MADSALTNARKAVAITRLLLRNGASNKAKDIVLSSLFSSSLLNVPSPLCVPAMRSAITLSKPPIGSETQVEAVARIARVAMAAGCGNCGEHAAVAFTLLRKWGAGPIDLMQRTTVDHAFVVIGRTGPVADVGAWGAGSAVCDPWDESAYPSAQAATKLWGGGTIAPKLFAHWSG